MINADDGDGSLIEQALLLQESLELTLVTPQEIVKLKRDKNWAQDSINWYLLERFGGIGFEDVTELTLIENKLTSLPESIGNLKNLRRLSISRNQLISLPDSIGNLIRLEYLYVQRNQLTSLPHSIGNLRNLRYLHLNFNKLTSLPESIGNLENLKKLFLAYNQLTALPHSIGNLRNLTNLQVMGNPLHQNIKLLKKLKSKGVSVYD